MSKTTSKLKLNRLGNGKECPLRDGKIETAHSRTAVLNSHYKKNGADDGVQIWHSDCYVLFVMNDFNIEKARTKLD